MMLAKPRWMIAVEAAAVFLFFEPALSFFQPAGVVHSRRLSDLCCSHVSGELARATLVPGRGTGSAVASSSGGSAHMSSKNSRISGDPSRDDRFYRRAVGARRRPSSCTLHAAAADSEASSGALAVDVSLPSSGDSSTSNALLNNNAAKPKMDATQKLATAAETAAGRHYDGDFLFEQKLESVKAAFLCGAIGASSRLLAVGAGALSPPPLRDVLATPDPAAAAVLFGLASGFAQGALFGLTYRYVVRADRKSLLGESAGNRESNGSTSEPATPQMDGFTVGHLGDGCVAAFALTSALGQSEAPLTLAAGKFVGAFEGGGGIVEALAAVLLPMVPFLLRAGGDLLLYTAARTAIDHALDQGVIEPFP